MHNYINKTIREIALDAPITTRVFETFKIDYCCGGRVSFAEACARAGVDEAVLLAALEDVTTVKDDKTEWPEQKSNIELARHIVKTHHAFTRAELTRLIPLAEKVLNRHGGAHPELAEVRSTLQELTDELLVHMRKEEALLFPYIGQLTLALEWKGSVPPPPFGTVNNPVRMMMFEHDQAGEQLRRLRTLTSDYTPPAGACPSYQGLYAGLEALEKDLHLHIHLENNVLFPRAIDDEKRILSDGVTANRGPAGSHACSIG